MKRTFLLCCCLALTAIEAIAQSVSGPTAPCPLASVEYSITLQRTCTGVTPAIEGVGSITTALQGVYSSDGTQVTWKIGVTWLNSYAIDNATGKQAPFKVTFNHTCDGSPHVTSLNVFPKALPDVVWQGYQTSIPCNFRGEVGYSIKPLVNANLTGYVWTSTAGWPAAGNTNSATFNVNNSSAGKVSVVATSGCTGVTRSASLDIARPAPAEAPTFTATIISDLCPSSSIPVSVTVGGLAPKGYEWYSTPANVLLINGASYNSTSSVLFTTSPSVTLSPGANSATARLYVRAVYNDCPPSPFAMQRMNVGTPSSYRFLVTGSRFDYSTSGPGNSYVVCPDEILLVYPQNNFEFNILEHQWQKVYGSDNGASIPTQYLLNMNATNTIGGMVSYQYRFRTSCGWSGWNTITITTQDCDGGGDPERKANTGSTRTRKDSVPVKETPAGTFDFKISPNPATNLLNIELKTAATSQALIYKITDISGKVVAEQKQAPQNRFQVNTSKLQPGNYIISLQQGTESVSKMFIITR